MVILITIVHVLVCLFMIVVVLLQSGKAADLAGAFGGMGSQTVFGPRGSATVLSKATTVSAVLFMLTSLALSIYATRGGGSTPSILDKATKPAASQPAPAQKGATPGPVTVTPSVGGQQGTPQQIPVQTLPPGQAPTLPAPAEKGPAPATK
jgi:preprotein translocase subunit SecG